MPPQQKGKYDDLDLSDISKYSSLDLSDVGQRPDVPAPDIPDDRGVLKKSWDWANKPLLPGVENFVYDESVPTYDASKDDPNKPGWLKKWLSFNEGVRGVTAKTAAGLTSPLNLAITAATLGTNVAANAGYTGTAAALNTGARGLSAGTAIHGGINVLHPDSTLTERGFGALEAIGGGLGAASGVPTPRPGSRGAALAAERAATKPTAEVPAFDATKKSFFNKPATETTTPTAEVPPPASASVRTGKTPEQIFADHPDIDPNLNSGIGNPMNAGSGVGLEGETGVRTPVAAKAATPEVPTPETVPPVGQTTAEVPPPPGVTPDKFGTLSPDEAAAELQRRLFGGEDVAPVRPDVPAPTPSAVFIEPHKMTSVMAKRLTDAGYTLDATNPIHPDGRRIRFVKTGPPVKAEVPTPEISTPETPVSTKPTAAVPGPHTRATLPRELAGARPRYNIGQRSWIPQFKNDVEKALYIISREKKSPRDADYVKFITDTLGLDEKGARALGTKIRGRIKAAAMKSNLQGDLELGELLTPEDIALFRKAPEVTGAAGAAVPETPGTIPPVTPPPVVPSGTIPTTPPGGIPPGGGGPPTPPPIIGPPVPPTPRPSAAPIPVPPNPSLWSKTKSVAGTVKENLFISGQRQLEKMGPVGTKIAKLIGDNETAASARGGRYVSQLHSIASGLEKAEQTDVARMIAGHQVPNPSAKVKSAYEEVKAIINKLGGEEANAGRFPGTDPGNPLKSGLYTDMPLFEDVVTPFEKFTADYLPKNAKGKFVETFFESYKANRTKFQNELVKSGMNAQEAAAHLKQLDLKGEAYLLTEEGGKLIKNFEHEMSFNIIEQHIYEMARKAEMADRFGADMLAPDAPLSKMIEALPLDNQKQAKELIDVYLGRGIAPSRGVTKAAGVITNAEVAMKLKNFVVNNFNDLTGTVRDAGVRRTVKSIGKAIFQSKQAGKEATEAGAFELFNRNLVDDPTFGSKISKLYGLEKVETFIRKVAANAGKATVEAKLAQFKKNPTSKVLEKELSYFMEHPPSDYVGATPKRTFSSKDLDFAGGRFTELTSGKPNVMKLPPAFFAQNPLARLPLLFKRFAFVQSKNMLDSLKRSYVPSARGLGKYKLPTGESAKALAGKGGRTIAAAIALGELTGDTVAGLKAMLDPDEDIKDAIKNRGDIRDRLMADMMQSWLFGLVGDAAKAGSSGTVSALKYMVGPVGSDIGEAGYGLMSLLDSKTDTGAERPWKSRFGPIRNWAARQIPVPLLGAGIGALLDTPENKPRSKYAPKPPTIPKPNR